MKYGIKSIRGTLLTTAATGVLMMFSSTAFAQVSAPVEETVQADAQEADATDEIVVTGFKGSLANSVSAKRNSTSIVEAVSAEEVGKLPDISIAE